MPATYSIVSKNSQTAWEIALQEYGSIEGARQLMIDNKKYRNFFGQKLSSAEFLISFDKVIDKKVFQYFQKNAPGNQAFYFIPDNADDTKFEDEYEEVPITYYEP
jgi:hypothetical protein